MKEWLSVVSEHAILFIDAIALLVIAAGTIQVAIAAVRSIFVPVSSYVMRDVWLHYARWLVAALTFQLAADIIETSISTSWDTIGRVGAIAAIRTFLNFFLDRDLEQIRTRQHANGSPARSAVQPHI
jgi:uncharacterized membrane protein